MNPHLLVLVLVVVLGFAGSFEDENEEEDERASGCKLGSNGWGVKMACLSGWNPAAFLATQVRIFLLRLLPGHSMSEVTQMLTAVERGEPHAAEELLPLVYNELRQLAAAQLAQENPGQTLQATALVHEAWLRLVGSPHGETAPRWEGRRHFFGAAAESMRRILIENARRKQSPKYGGGLQRVNWERIELAEAVPPDELLALDEALEELGRLDPEAGELIKLRFYAGLTDEQAAEVLGVSRRTAIRLWAYARAWLYRKLRGRPAGGR